MPPNLPSMFALLSVLLFAAGCTESSTPNDAVRRAGEPVHLGPNETASETPPLLGFKGCSELDFIVPIPAALFDLPPPMVAKAMDPAGQVIGIIVTVMRCASLTINGTEHPDATAMFELLPVEPVAGVTVPNATSYQWLGFLSTNLAPLREAFAARGVEVDDDKVTVSFADLPNQPKSRGSFAISSASGGDAFGESAMVGSPFQGKAGTLGLYTFPLDGGGTLRAHAVQFTDYRGYDHGALIVSPGVLPFAGVVPSPSAAYHNLDYGADFVLDLAQKA